MKDDKEHIDQLFESLNDRQFDIPEAFLEDLNKRLDNEPKKRRYSFLWFLASLLFIGSITIGYFQYSDHSEVKSPVNQVNKLIAPGEYKNGSTKLHTQNTHHLSGQNQNNQQAVDSISSSLQPRNTQINTPKNTQQQTKSSTSIQWSQFIVKNQKSPIKHRSKRLKNTSKKTQIEIRMHKQTKGDKLLNSAKNEVTQGKMAQNSISGIVDNTPVIKPENKELAKESIPEKEKDSAITQTACDSTQQVNPNQPEVDATLPEIKTSANNWKKEITLFGGLGGNSMHDSSKDSSYLAKINQNQRSILTPSFGINTNLSYKKFTFGLGINYEQTGEKFKTDLKSNILKDSTYSELIHDTIWVQDTIGNWFPMPYDTTIYHTVQYTDFTWTSKSFQNRYSWISIPIHFGYRFKLGDFELIPRIGAVFNFGIAQGHGTYPNASFNSIDRYQPVKFNVSYLIQLEARRNFDKWFVFINPYFRSMINPAISSDVLRRKYASWGMQFGIGLNL